MRGPDRFLLLVLVFLTLAALDHASEVHQLTAADAERPHAAAARGGDRDEGVVVLGESDETGREDRKQAPPDWDGFDPDLSELVETTEGQKKHCYRVKWRIDAVEKDSSVLVEDGGDWKPIACSQVKAECEQRICAPKLMMKVEQGSIKFTAISGQQEIASDISIKAGMSQAYDWGPEDVVNNCQKIKVQILAPTSLEALNAATPRYMDSGMAREFPADCLGDSRTCYITTCGDSKVRISSSGGSGFQISMWEGTREMASKVPVFNAVKEFDIKGVPDHDPSSTGPKEEDTSSPPAADSESMPSLKKEPTGPPPVPPPPVPPPPPGGAREEKTPPLPDAPEADSVKKANADGTPTEEFRKDDPNCKDGVPPPQPTGPSPQTPEDIKRVEGQISGVIIANNRHDPSNTEQMKQLNKGDPEISDKIDRLLVLHGKTSEAINNEFEPKKNVNDPETKAKDSKPAVPRKSFQWADTHRYSEIPHGNGKQVDTKLQIASEKVPAAERFWTIYKTPDGKEFFRNDATGYAQWHEPVGDVQIHAKVVDLQTLLKSPVPKNSTATTTSSDGISVASTSTTGKLAQNATTQNSTEVSVMAPSTPRPLETNDLGNSTTTVFKAYLYQEDKTVMTCCNGMNENTNAPDFTFLDLNSDGKMGLQAVPAECEQKCRTYAGCKFFQINPKVLSDWCMGFKNCDKQCVVTWKKPSTIFKVGNYPMEAPGADKPTPSPSYKTHTEKDCSGSTEDAAAAEIVTDSAACERRCNELGSKCTAFVLPSTGANANKCFYKSGKLTVSPQTAGDTRDCYEKVPAALPWSYVKYEGKDCTGSTGDLLRSFQAATGTESCEDKCTQMGENCAGFVYVKTGPDVNEAGGKVCHLRQGSLKIADSKYGLDDRDCYKKVASAPLLAAGEPVGSSTNVQSIAVSGAEGGHNDDNGGELSNGVYHFDQMYNGKPGYKRTDDQGKEYTIRWNEAGKQDWAAVHLAGNKDCWVLKGGEHIRFFVPSELDTPPQSGWTPRSEAATGTLSVEATDPGKLKGNSTLSITAVANNKPLEVEGASGQCGDKVNGLYTDFDRMNNKPVYKNANGYTIRFESAAKQDRAAVMNNKDTWVFLYGQDYVLFITSSADVPPQSGWTKPAAGSCVEGAADVSVTESTSNMEVDEPTELYISGGQGGYVDKGTNDNGGLSANGKYEMEDSYYNNKPTYKNTNGCIIKYESVDNGDFGAKEIAKGDAWTVNCKGHHRYFHKVDSSLANFPPQNDWTNRQDTATGSIQVSSAIPNFDPVEITGASGQGASCNGLYKQDGFFNGKPIYKSTVCTMKFEETAKGDAGATQYGSGKDLWIISDESNYRYFDSSDGPKAPVSGWTKITGKAEGTLALCEGTGCAPPTSAPTHAPTSAPTSAS